MHDLSQLLLAVLNLLLFLEISSADTISDTLGLELLVGLREGVVVNGYLVSELTADVNMFPH